VIASDDYYSLTSDGSSNDDHRNGHHYETPPLRKLSSRDVIPSEATISSLQPVQDPQRTDNEAIEKPAAVIPADADKVRRKPLSPSPSSAGTVVRRPISEAISPPTPGVDDTPYIQFAIDQLTRDEEVAGHGRGATENASPIQRAAPDPSLRHNTARNREKSADSRESYSGRPRRYNRYSVRVFD